MLKMPWARFPPTPKWDVNHFLYNGGSLFTRGTNPTGTLVWLVDTKVLLEHMGCPLELWVLVTGGAIRGKGRICWRSILASSLESLLTEEIAWVEFH